MKNLFFLIIFLSTALSAQWHESSFRSSMNNSSTVTTLYYDGTLLWAGSRSQVYNSADKGVSWSNVTSGGITVNQADVKAIIRLNEYVYVAFGGNGNKTIYRSNDNGQSWMPDMEGYTQFQHVTHFYTYNDYIVGKLETNAVLYKKNSDKSWSTLAVPDSRFASPATIFTKGDSLVITSGQSGPAIALTTDMGQNWKIRSTSWGNDIPANGDWHLPVWHGRFNSGQVYGVNRGFVTSPRLEYVYNFVSSDDGMTTFTKKNTFFQTETISTMWIHNNEIFVAYSRSNVWHSSDGGLTFTDITANLKSFVQYLHLPILSMEVVDNKLFIAGNQNGILVYELVTSVDSHPTIGVLSTVISGKYLLSTFGESALYQIFNLNGKLKYSGQVQGMNQEIDIRHLPGGMYILHVESEGKTSVHKLIKY